jgi:hypothetical protein
VNRPKPVPQWTREALKEDPDLMFRDNVPPITVRRMVREVEASHGVRLIPTEVGDRVICPAVLVP